MGQNLHSQKDSAEPRSAFLCARKVGKKDYELGSMAGLLPYCARSRQLFAASWTIAPPGSSVRGLQARTLEWEVVLIFK